MFPLIQIVGTVVLLTLIACVALPIMAWRRQRHIGLHFTEGHSLEDYRKAHPRSFGQDGTFLKCHACGGRGIQMKHFGKTSYGVHHSHVCRQCGLELWRSTLPPADI
jgi:hypothetical protein